MSKVRNLIVGTALAGVSVLGVEALTNVNFPVVPDVGDLFNGGQGDDSVHGGVIYEGQEVQTASEDFMVQIGTGTATVSVEAVRRWDTPGGVFSGDFVSDNGTASVRAEDGSPATLELQTRYCSDGSIEVDRDNEGRTLSVQFDMGSLSVCGVDWVPSAENAAFFSDDDVPDDVNGEFVSVIQNAAITTVAAGECPESLTSQYTNNLYLTFVGNALSREFNIKPEHVDVIPGSTETTDTETQKDLADRLEDVMRDEDIAYLTPSSIDDSCFADQDQGEPISNITGIGLPPVGTKDEN